jgi:DNA repair protein RadC
MLQRVLARLTSRSDPPLQPAAWTAQPFDAASPPPRAISGFAETAAHVGAVFAGAPPPRRANTAAAEAQAAAPFPSTGPHGHRQRLRQKLIERGADALADYELLEMLLFFAQPKGDTKPLAKQAINRFGSFGGVLAAPTGELAAFNGFGEHSIAAIRLVQAAAVRLAQAEVRREPVLSNWDALIGYLNAVQGREKVEQFRVLFLDTRNRLLADEAQARGSVNHTPVYPREILRRALDLGATALLLVHNHPSGDTTPSREDVLMTNEIIGALRPVGIAVHDHIIVGRGNWLSFRREGMLA